MKTSSKHKSEMKYEKLSYDKESSSNEQNSFGNSSIAAFRDAIKNGPFFIVSSVTDACIDKLLNILMLIQLAHSIYFHWRRKL